ncbi:MAG: hypothetical protein M3004_00055 [Bacteroidota bacterium]|nr:hypothetical protein [Bacteroidota bacterium]
MNKNELNEQAAKYRLLSKKDTELFFQEQKERIEKLSPQENKQELKSIKNIIIDLKKEAEKLNQLQSK